MPINKVEEFERQFIQILEASHRADVLDQIKAGKLTDEVTAILDQVAAQVSAGLAPAKASKATGK